MTEADWIACADPNRMLDFLRRRADDRKLRLFGCACCRHFWDVLTDPRSRRIVELTELHVDGRASDADLQIAAWEAHAAWSNAPRGAKARHLETADIVAELAWRGARASPMVIAIGWASQAGESGQPFKDPDYQCQVLRDVFLPFAELHAEMAWRTAVVQELARTAYHDRSFDVLPILGDALEEAGCGDSRWLDHCRQPTVHVRGCWLVDALLSST